MPYRGAGQAINDLIAGHVKFGLLGPTATVPHYRAGKLHLLANSSAKRPPYISDVPTIEEAGMKGVVLESWYAAFVPKGTPTAIIARLNAEMGKALADPAMKESFTRGSRRRPRRRRPSPRPTISAFHRDQEGSRNR